MNDSRSVIREVHTACQASDRLYCLLPQSDRRVLALVSVDDDRYHELEVLLDVRAEHHERVEDLQLGERYALAQLDVEHLEKERQCRRLEGLEL